MRMKKVLRETQTLRAGCSKAEPIRSAADPIPGGAGRPKSNQLETVTIPLRTKLQTQFGEDRCMQFPIIVVTDTQTHPPTHRQDRLQYTAPQLS